MSVEALEKPSVVVVTEEFESFAHRMETKRLVLDAERDNIARAKELEGAAFARLLSLPDARGRVAAQLDKGPR